MSLHRSRREKAYSPLQDSRKKFPFLFSMASNPPIGILSVYDPCRLLGSGHRLPELLKLFCFDELGLTYSLYLIIVDIELSGLIELCGHGIALFMASHFVRREYEPPA